MSIAERLKIIRQEISEAAKKSHRSADDILLVAVSKGQPFDAIEEVYNQHQRHFGESYAQEMIIKIKEAQKRQMTDIIWHYIGAIQSNKIKTISEAQIIESIDSLRHAELLDEQVKDTKNIFLQVNLSEAKERHGFLPSELALAIEKISRLKYIKIKGLMTILPLKPERPPGYWLTIMSNLRDELVLSHGLELSLSMGMSDDFKEAIAHGADLVRIGSSIFGPRTKT